MPKTYTVKEVADILGFSTNSIYTFLKEKRIKGVRIGKGRFRIPEEELSRLLHLSKVPKQSIAPLIAPPAPHEDTISIDIKRRVPPDFDAVLLSPNIFDWFVGMAALVAGVGLFLFNASVAGAALAPVTNIFPIIRIVLIACGLGILVSGMFTQGKSWHGVFHLALSVLGGMNAFMLARSGDVGGALIYGGLAAVIAITHVFPISGIGVVGWYASLIAVSIPVTFLFFPGETQVQMLQEAFGISPFFVGISSIIVAVFFLIAFWVGYGSNRRLFVAATCLAAFFDMVIAIWYAHLQLWSRSFFMLVVGYFTGLLPYWWPLQETVRKRYKLMLHGLFIVIGSVFFVAILVVYLLQQNIWYQRGNEFVNKIQIAQTTLTGAVSSVQSSLTVASGNRDFVESVAKKDLVSLNTIARIIYESNPNIRRLVFLDKNGDGIALYPYGTFDEPNFSYREYFQQAKSTGEPYISDVFQARADNEGRYVVVVAVPLRDSSGGFVGVMTASLDLERFGVQLAQIASALRGEYFVITDRNGVILLHPNQTLIGTTAPPNDPIFRGIGGETGVMQNVLIEKSYGMIAYANVPTLRWGISLRAQSSTVFTLTSFTIWAVLGTVIAILVVSDTMFAFMRSRMEQEKEASPG